MSAPRLTLVHDDGLDGLHVSYDTDTAQWSNDYADPEVSMVMIDGIETMMRSEPGATYTPYPWLDKLAGLSEQFGFKLCGVPELVAYLQRAYDPNDAY